MTASERFKNQLLEQLQEVVAERPASPIPASRRPRRALLAMAAGLSAAAIAAAAIVAGSGDVTPSAYAVDSQPDGEVTVSIHSLSDADGLQRSLQAAGVPAVVNYVPADQSGCLGPPSREPSDGRPPGDGATPERSEVGSDAAPGSSASAADKASGVAAAKELSSKVKADGDGVTFSIDANSIKPGEKLYITTSTGSVDTIGIAVSGTEPGAAC